MIDLETKTMQALDLLSTYRNSTLEYPLSPPQRAEIPPPSPALPFMPHSSTAA